MSQGLPTLPLSTYGSLKDDAATKLLVGGSERAPAVDRSGIWQSLNKTASGEEEQQQQQQQQQRRRLRRGWRNLAAAGALAIGAAAVASVVYTRQPSYTSTSAGLVDVGVPAAETTPSSRSSPVQKEARSFPKPAMLSPTPPSASASASAPARETPADAEKNLAVAPLSFEATNFYHLRDGKPALDYPWLQGVKLVEPHRETTLTVSSPRDRHEYVWEIYGVEADEGDLRTTAAGAEAVVVLTVLDENMITLKEVNSEGEVVRQLQERVMVKYVRREIRTLTDEEREELLDAMHTLWEVRVDGGDGKELYGNDYADIYAISRLHFMAAMNKTCDHFHDGIGFLTNHVMISNTFEYSLQRVNPKLTLPYWDWTIEGVEAGILTSTSEADVEINSPLFQDSWFGAADPDDYVVKDGRWAYSEIPTVYSGNPGDDIPDVYERQRSRWVVNSSPYMVRGLGKMCDKRTTELYPWPTCDVHYNLVTDYSDWYSFAWMVLYQPHGPVHAWIGGMMNCDETLGTISDLIGKENTDSLMLYAFDQRKEFWLNDFFDCDGYAKEGAEGDKLISSGKCGCLGYDLTQGDDWKTIYYNSTVDFDAVISDYDDDTKRQVVEATCESKIYVGDNIHAGSSFDPTFWLIHPTMERLYMYTTLTGQLTDMTWPDNDATSTSEELGFYGGACKGHGGGDVFPFGLLDNDPDGFEIKTGIKGNMGTGNTMTNREVLAVMDPSVNMLPYVYDTFKWDHCLDAGVDFDDAWNTMRGTTAKPPAAARTAEKPSAE